MRRVRIFVVGLAISILALVKVADGIGCFVCHSVEGSDPGCEDPFAPADAYYWEECLATKHNDDRDSFSNNNQSDDDTELYLASHCIKVSGIFMDNGETLVSRSCALDSGDGGEDVASDSGGRRCRVIEVGAEEEETAAGNETTEVKRRMLNSCIHKCRDGTAWGQDGCNGARRDTGLAATFRVILAISASISRLVAQD